MKTPRFVYLCLILSSWPCITEATQKNATGKQSKTAASAKQSPSNKTTQEQPAFRWSNPPRAVSKHLKHETFLSPSMKIDVGYYILLPPQYSEQSAPYPVVYYLHGGRPGNEQKGTRLAPLIFQWMEEGKVPPMIYVFLNGGPVSHYNMPDRKHAMGEDIFIKELIPHVDTTYRTIASRNGRGIEGFSQGGRGTTRIMFKYPELFCSAAPGGSGYATEKRISENNGRESDALVFQPGDNTWDLAKKYASQKNDAGLPILIHVGTKDFNYEGNLAYMKHLERLNIPFEQLIVEDTPHSALRIYERDGIRLAQFHAKNFSRKN
jgi:endo-1,4-beta-xylanase